MSVSLWSLHLFVIVCPTIISLCLVNLHLLVNSSLGLSLLSLLVPCVTLRASFYVLSRCFPVFKPLTVWIWLPDRQSPNLVLIPGCLLLCPYKKDWHSSSCVWNLGPAPFPMVSLAIWLHPDFTALGHLLTMYVYELLLLLLLCGSQENLLQTFRVSAWM